MWQGKAEQGLQVRFLTDKVLKGGGKGSRAELGGASQSTAVLMSSLSSALDNGLSTFSAAQSSG